MFIIETTAKGEETQYVSGHTFTRREKAQEFKTRSQAKEAADELKEMSVKGREYVVLDTNDAFLISVRRPGQPNGKRYISFDPRSAANASKDAAEAKAESIAATARAEVGTVGGPSSVTIQEVAVAGSKFVVGCTPRVPGGGLAPYGVFLGEHEGAFVFVPTADKAIQYNDALAANKAVEKAESNLSDKASLFYFYNY